MKAKESPSLLAPRGKQVRSLTQARKVIEEQALKLIDHAAQIVAKGTEITNLKYRAESLEGEQRRLNNLINEERLSKAKVMEERDLNKQKHSEAVAERDRLMRLVDQFTSVQIVSHGANLQQGQANFDTPRSLRNDGLKAVK